MKLDKLNNIIKTELIFRQPILNVYVQYHIKTHLSLIYMDFGSFN